MAINEYRLCFEHLREVDKYRLSIFERTVYNGECTAWLCIGSSEHYTLEAHCAPKTVLRAALRDLL